MTNKLSQFKEDLEFLEDWEDKYSYIIGLGKRLPTFEYKYEEFKVPGCVSSVWIVPHIDENNIITLKGDSDAHIVKGILYIILQNFSGVKLSNIRECQEEFEEFIKSSQLTEYLTPTRANGVHSIIKYIQNIGI